MLGHRTLNVEDYVAILKRRWWVIAIPALILPILAIGLTFVIPPQYKSTTVILVDQQKVPNDFVHPIVTESLDSRLESMREEIESRTSIQPIIEKYNLYGSKHLSMDDRIDLMRKNLEFYTVESELTRASGLPGFTIMFTNEDAHTAQQVCADIAGMFTGADLRSRTDIAQGTTDFLKERLESAKRSLDDQDAKRAAFKSQHMGMLPGEEGNNAGMLGTLNSQLDATTQQIQTLEQNKSVMEAMLAQQSQTASTPASAAAVQTPQVQQKELDDLLAQESDLSAHYTADYPDVKAVRRKIEDLQKQMAKAASAPPPPVAPAAPATPHVDSVGVQTLRAQIRGLDLAIQTKHKQQDELDQQIHTYQNRIQSSPQVEEQYEELTRDYQSSQTLYQGLLAQMQKADEATDLEVHQEGETFRVLDPANLPLSPTFPKRSVFASGGLGAGLALGLLIVALIEYKDTALRSERDVWAFTQLPTLAVIAWSGDMTGNEVGGFARLKRLFSRKPPSELLTDASG